MPQHADEYANVIDANPNATRSPTNFEKMREKIQQRINEAREKYVQRYYLRKRKHNFKVGDIVYRENTILSDASKYISKKLSRKRVRCVITEQTGTNVFKLRDLSTGKEAEYHVQKFCR